MWVLGGEWEVSVAALEKVISDLAVFGSEVSGGGGDSYPTDYYQFWVVALPKVIDQSLSSQYNTETASAVLPLVMSLLQNTIQVIVADIDAYSCSHADAQTACRSRKQYLDNVFLAIDARSLVNSIHCSKVKMLNSILFNDR
mgnify:CR=1 FL=1